MGEEGGEAADVVIHIAHDDLMSLMIGQLSPFDAYLSGKISIEGGFLSVLKLTHLFSAHLLSTFQAIPELPSNWKLWRSTSRLALVLLLRLPNCAIYSFCFVYVLSFYF